MRIWDGVTKNAAKLNKNTYSRVIRDFQNINYPRVRYGVKPNAPPNTDKVRYAVALTHPTGVARLNLCIRFLACFALKRSLRTFLLHHFRLASLLQPLVGSPLILANEVLTLIHQVPILIHQVLTLVEEVIPIL